MSAVCDEVYQRLDPVAARLYRCLGLHPGPWVDLGVAAAMLGADTGVAGVAVRELLTAALLIRVGDDRYRIDDLGRVDARDRAGERETAGDRDAVLGRIGGYYLDQATAADLVAMPDRDRLSPRYQRLGNHPARFSRPRDALDWTVAELPNLVAIQRTMAQLGWDEMVWQVAEALWSVCLYRNPPGGWRATAALAMVSAHRTGDPVAEARMSIQLAFAHLRSREFDQAGPLLTDALRLATAAGHDASVATAVEHLGVLAQARGELRQAIEHYTHALGISRGIGQRRGQAILCRRLGEACRRAAQPDQALAWLHQAVDLTAELGDEPLLTARTLTVLGAVHTGLGDTETALKHLNSALALTRHLSAEHYTAEICEALAELHQRDHHPDLAGSWLRQADEIYRRLGSPHADRTDERLAALTPGQGPATYGSTPGST